MKRTQREIVRRFFDAVLSGEFRGQGFDEAKDAFEEIVDTLQKVAGELDAEAAWSERWSRVEDSFRPPVEALIVGDVLTELAGREGIDAALLAPTISTGTRDEILETLVEIVAGWVEDIRENKGAARVVAEEKEGRA